MLGHEDPKIPELKYYNIQLWVWATY